MPGASHEATIFTDDMPRRAQQLGTEVTKTTAVEISPSVPVDRFARQCLTNSRDNVARISINSYVYLL